MTRDQLRDEWRRMAVIVRTAGLVLDGDDPVTEEHLERWMDALGEEEKVLASLRRRTVDFLRKQRAALTH